MTDTPLAGKLALVTGASRGIGAATAIALAARGAHVVLTARTAAGLRPSSSRSSTPAAPQRSRRST